MNFFAPVATWGFWILLVIGWAFDGLHVKGTAVFLLLWLAGFFGSPFVFDGMLFTSYVAVLDIVLVLVIFKGDIRLR